MVKTECRNSMLMGDMSISRLITHGQQVEGNKFKEKATENKKVRYGKYDNSVEIRWWKSLTELLEFFSPNSFIRQCSIIQEQV